MKICALTTKDNKWDYFKQPDEWASYDAITGYRATSMMGRFAHTSSDISYEENAREVERAIDDIIKYDVVGVFKKVFIEVPDP